MALINCKLYNEFLLMDFWRSFVYVEFWSSILTLKSPIRTTGQEVGIGLKYFLNDTKMLTIIML